MNEIKSLDQLSLVLGFIVPGLVILYFRAQFLTGRLAPHKDNILSYFTLSAVYLAIVEAVFSAITGSAAPSYRLTPYWLPIILVGGAVFGILTGLNARFGATRWMLAKIGIQVPHALTTAWDWRFSRFPECLVTITLQDGSKVYGWCGVGSFIGSDPESRDLYIVQVYDVDEEGTWTLKTPGKGIYIAAGEVRLIEFIPDVAGKPDEPVAEQSHCA
jgi:hypothetical protein